MEDSVELPSGPGKEAQKYKKVRVLGEGSMGRAYLVKSEQDSKLYVMKRINIGHLGEKEKENALRQAQLHSLFQHPNIVQLKQVYQTTGEKICIIMEYAEGGDLEEYIQQQSGKLLKEQTILSMFAQICLGLQEIHDKRIVHRDIKTANIFLTLDKNVKIGDFGISKSLDKTVMAATTMVGTPYYLSPEMVEGKSYSTKADIWALGVILYQLCSFKLPFDASSLPVLALKILKGSFPPISNIYSKEMKALILQMLQVDQKKRPSIDAILQKPFIFKHLSKEEQARQKEKVEKKKQAVKQKQKREEEKKVKAVDKAQEEKMKARREKEEKRQEMRKQMRDDLRKKRAEKEYQSQKSSVSEQTPLKTTLEQKKNFKIETMKTPKIQPSSMTQEKREPPVKPWKNRKPAQKKDITIQMYVPEVKPKPKQEVKETSSDFKVQIFVSKKPQNYSPSHLQQPLQERVVGGRKSMPEIDPSQNYHYSQKNIREELSEMKEQQSQKDDNYEDEDEQENTFDMEELLQNIKNLQQKTRNLPEPSKSVCLYEESQNFDSTIPDKIPTKPQPKPEEIDNLNSLLNSESLEELRQILEDRLGEQQFIYAYNALKQHIASYYEMIDQNQKVDRETLKQQYVFNKALLRQKLKDLSSSQFQKNIELLFTLIVYEDLEMQKNRSEEEGIYSELF